MKLSVIVPVYNVEKFLPRCLDSLLRQGMEPGEWEVICINDGSPDNCAAILAKYEQKHPDVFKIITQENMGLGGARNVGMALAQGEYVTYLDSDDYLVDDGYRYLLDNFCGDGIKEGGTEVKLDVLCFNYRFVYTDGKTLFDPDAKPDGVISIEGDGVDIYNQHNLSYVWSKFYRRAFLEEHHIQSEIVISQDQLFNFDVFRQHPYTRVVTSSVVRYENANTVSVQKITDREVVLVQLNDLYYNMGRVRNYLNEGNTDLAPAAHRVLGQFKETYYNKMIRTNLRYEDWKKYTKVLDVETKGESFIVLKSGWAERIVGMLKEMIVHSYVGYLFVRFLYREIFVRFFFEKIYNKR
jgi:glycosyltransferase involved in cell wall biosynthesis